MLWPRFRWLSDWWRQRSLRARITIAATTLFAVAVVAGTVLLVAVLRGSLIRSIDSSATKSGRDVADLVLRGNQPEVILPGSGGDYMQVVDSRDLVLGASPNAAATKSMLKIDQLARARDGRHFTISADWAVIDTPLRVSGVAAG